jgi:hypothetical protein
MLASCLLAVMASGQDVAWQAWGTSSRKIEGRVQAISDVNQDGHEDIVAVVGGTWCGPVGLPYSGAVWVLSGADGSLLYERLSLPLGGQTYFQVLAEGGDWNQDGVGDFASIQFGAGAQAATVHSGVDGSPLLTVPVGLPFAVLATCDVNGDGLCELIIGDQYVNVVSVLSHAGVLMYNLMGNPAMAIGSALTDVGDVDNDGGDDFVMGCVEPGGRGTNVIVSGRTGSYIRMCYGEQPGDMMFSSADRCGDVDRDGYQDFVVSTGVTAANRSGMVIFSSRTGQVLRSWYPTTAPEFGKTVSGRGVDYDGDGTPDVVTGARAELVSPQQSGAVYVMSGRDGSLIHRVISQPSPMGAFGQIGIFITGMRPPPGGHTGILVVPDPQALQSQGLCTLNPQMGRIRAHRGLPRTSELLGPACNGNLSTAPDLGLQSIGTTTIRAHLSDAPPNVPAVLLLGATNQTSWTPMPLPLDGVGLPGCLLRSPVDLLLVTTTGSTGMQAGYASLDLPLPAPLQGMGTWWVAAQWLVLGTPATFPGGMTQTVRWRR